VRQLHVILGPTAVGKGRLARALARRIGAQIISVDSMKVYRHMDIGTAKPSAAARAEVPHHCLDLVEPTEGFSAARYVAHADRAIEAVRAAGARPLAVGGTTLYLRALIEGLFEGPPADADLRAELRSRARRDGLPALHAELAAVDSEAARRIHPNDEKRIIRALEVHRLTGRAISELQRQWDAQRRYDCRLLGLRRERSDLHGRINRRAERMIAAGLRDEVAALLAEPGGLSAQAAAAVGYAEMIEHLRGERSLDETCERIKMHTRRLAKKQQTWQRRLGDVRWFDVTPDETADALAERILKEVAFE